MSLIIQNDMPNYFSKKLLKYIFIKSGTQGLKCSNLQSGNLH